MAKIGGSTIAKDASPDAMAKRGPNSLNTIQQNPTKTTAPNGQLDNNVAHTDRNTARNT